MQGALQAMWADKPDKVHAKFHTAVVSGEEKESTVCRQAPGVKSGGGGLRDFQGVLWMAKVKFGNQGLGGLVRRKYLSEQESISYSDAYSFLLRVRNELHFLSKRPVDILHLEKQPEVALGLGYKEEDIFRRYFKRRRYF